MSDPMPMIVPPLFWEWFNIWLTEFLKDLYHEIKMVGLRGGNNANSPYLHTCTNHGTQSQPTGIDLTLNIPTSLTMSQPAAAPHLNPNQINLQSLSTVSLQFVPSVAPANPGSHNHHSHSRSHSHGHNHINHSLNPSLNHSHSHNNNIGLGGGHCSVNSVGLNSSHSHSNNLGVGVSHNHNNKAGLGGSHAHTNTLGLNSNHSHTNNLGISGNHSHASSLGLGGSHSHANSLGLSANHSHKSNLSQLNSGNHSHSSLGVSGSHTSSLGLGGSHSHSANLGLGASHTHSSNLSLGGSHSHSSNLGLSSHNHTGNLGLGSSHNHSTNLGLGGNHSHSTSTGLGGSHSHKFSLGLGGSQSHSSNLGLGGHSLISSINPISSISANNSQSLGSSHSLSGSQSLSSGQNLNNGHNLIIGQNKSSSQNHNSGLNLSTSQRSVSNSHNNSHSNSHQPHKNESSRYSTTSCGLSSQSQQFRLLKQACRPVECYHPSGATAATFMPSTTGGTQSSSQTSLRVQPTPPQPSAPPAPQQDLSKTTMAGHNFVSQSQTQPRPQYNFQYRATQHGSRPNSHPRQQQPFIPGAASSTGPMMYPTLVFQPTHMGMQTYPQPRSGSPGYYQYHMGHYIGYNNPPSHTPPYYGYATNSPQLPTPNLQTNTSGGRSNPTTLVGPQGTPATPTAPAASIPHAQPPTHLHQSMPGIRPAPVQKRSHRLPIIDPNTNKEIFSDLYPSNNEYFLSGEQNDRQTPQPEPPTHSIAEEFTRMVNEAVNQPSLENTKSNFVPKNVEMPVSSTSTAQPQNAISSLSSINNNVIKSELVNLNDNRNLGPEVAATPCETPVVSAISDSPVIVPKMTLNVKPIQKIETTVQSFVDTSRNTQINIQSNKSSALPTEKVDDEGCELPSESVPANTAVVSVAPSVTETTTTTVAATSSPLVTTAAMPAHTPLSDTLPSYPITTAAPQPQRPPRDRVHKSEEKDKQVKIEKETPVASSEPMQNGPTSTQPICSVDSTQQAISTPTSHKTFNLGATVSKKPVSKTVVPPELVNPPAPEQTLTATELLSASIEKVAREPQEALIVQVPEKKSSAFEAQAKLTQSISSVCRVQQSESKMKDININSNKSTDPDTANGNTTEVKVDVKEDINKNEKSVKNTKNNNKKAAKMANNDAIMEPESCENGKDETDKVVNVEQEVSPVQEETETPIADENPAEKSEETQEPKSPVFLPKYKYSEEQWSPLNKSGKKCYDIGLLKQIKEDPLSKNKPNAPLLETLNIIRTTPMQEPMPFTPISRPVNDSLFPPFLKGGLGGPRNATHRDPKKDGRNVQSTGKGSIKLSPSQSSNSSPKPVIHVSLSLREDVKLKEVDSAWKPTRFRKENLAEDELKTQELYKKFRGILNKLTPQKFDTLLDKVKNLEINNQKRMEGVIDLLFEKAIEEPNFSEAYATMCNKLSTLKVPSDSNPDQCVNFRGLIISKCQNQFETGKSDEQVLKLEKELAETNDPAKKKELQMMIVEENRKVRLRSVANVRFIGELYKLKMLTCKIMDYCMGTLIDKLEEEKLECLCKLLTTIGEQFENESGSKLDVIFKKMQEIVDRKSNKISSRVKFMIQDVIDLRRRRWVIKSVVDSQPKMMDQIQKEAEQQARHIELMNASGMSGGGGGGGGGSFRRDDGGRGKRGGDNRRQNQFMDNTFPRTRTTNFPVDTNKLKKAVTQKSLNDIKLAPTHWVHGAAGAKSPQAQPTSNSQISISKNMYSVLENVHSDMTSLRGNRDVTPNYSKGASIERSTFNSRDFASGGGRSGSVGVARSNSTTRTQSSAPVAAEAPAPEVAPVPTPPQEPLAGDKMRNAVKSIIGLSIINHDNDELVADVKQLFKPQFHAAVVAEILNVLLEKSAKEFSMISKSLFHLVSTNTIAPENFLAGIKETFEYAPDLYIDIPMLYENLGKVLAPHLEKKYITIAKVFEFSGSIISANQGNLLLKSIISNLMESMGPTFVKSKWQESGLQLNQWMSEEQVPKWIADNKFEFLEGNSKPVEESAMILTPAETQSRLLQLMNSDESCDCIKGWVQDKLGKASNEDWFMRSLIQAICEHALYGNEGRDVPHFNQDRMSKYVSLIHEFGDSKQSREANCLFGIQHLIHKLEHPQGLTLEIFQYFNEHYFISLEGFLAWEESEKEPEGKGVMLKALTSFFTNIKEADNEDSGSED